MIRQALLMAAALAACDAPPNVEAQQTGRAASLFAAAPSEQLRLPGQLREISGLAVSVDGRLFAHDDERAVIYEIDVEHGGLAKAFALGNPGIIGDFEGLAAVPEGTLWLATSRGILYRFREGDDGAHVAYHAFDTGRGDVCEIEGLAYLPAEEGLILACKQNHASGMRGAVTLYLWPFSGPAELWRSYSEAQIARAAGVRRFRPSAVEIDPVSGRVLVLSANDQAFIELDRDGNVIAARALRGHPQPEGIAVLPDGSLVIADEGGRGAALLSRYARAP